VNLTSLKEAEQAKSATPTTLTFLSSLTIGTPLNRCHPAALKYLTDFKKKKERGPVQYLSYIYLGSSVCLSSCHIPVVLSYSCRHVIFLS
jgi:hypothetical protein